MLILILFSSVQERFNDNMNGRDLKFISVVKLETKEKSTEKPENWDKYDETK